MSSDSNSAGVNLRRIFILLWKNLIFRKRHYVVTAFEIILPTIFAVLMAYLKADLGVNIDATDSTSGRNNVTYFPEYSQEQLLVRIFPNEYYCGGTLTIPYAPDNEKTNATMKELERKLEEFSKEQCKERSMTNVTSLPFESEREVEIFNTQLGLVNWELQLSFKFAIIFDEGFRMNETHSERISYKLRFVDFELDTSELMPWFPIPGPNWGNQNYYRRSGFSGVQILLDKIIIKQTTQHEPEFNISTQTFPYPPYQNYDFANLYSILLPQFLVQGFIFIVPSILRGVVSEKQTGIKELMKMMGLPNWMHWVGWMLNSLIVLVFSVTIVVILFFIPFNSDAGAVLEFSDPSLWWVVLFMYVIAATSFCFFISSFFHKPTLATTVGVVLWLVSYYALSLPLDPQYQRMNLATKMSIAILPNMALHYSIKIMSGYEGQGVGAQWNNIGRSVSSVDPLCLWHMLLMYIISTVLYISLTMYIENVLPSKYGLRKPWYYIFQPSEWGLQRKKKPDLSTFLEDGVFSEPGFEDEPTQLKAGIKVSHLRKVFGNTKVAVNDVSIKFFYGQITALLGHNGAGKTTMMSILTGMFSPTSGTATVNGYDIREDMINVRKSLGLCPQHNMLFDKLTVEEHLIFFGMLKGLSGKDAKTETEEIMKKMKIDDKKNVLSMSLSGGQKRKVSLGCALIGGTKVVILDEPTSGMDIESRRALWDILLEMRGHRTIVLTTHFMEEADVLGDRIAIMADGKLQCCGSPMFLKTFYGTGYSLKMVISPESQVQEISTLLQRHITNLTLKDQSDSELTFTIPAESGTQSAYPALFSDLNKHKTKLGIQTIGLSLTTMDEVFVKVGELHNNLHKVETASRISSSVDSSTENLHQMRATGLSLVILQFYALFIKKLVYTFRKRRLFLSQFIFPVLLTMAAILISNTVIAPSSDMPSLTIRLSDYFEPITLYSDSSDGGMNLGESYAEAVGISAQETDDVSETLLTVGEEDIGIFRERYLIAAELNNTNMKAMFSSIPKHATPLSINMLSNAMLNYFAKNDSAQHSIEVTNYPLKSQADEIYRLFRANPTYAETIPILFAVFMPIGLALLSASYIVFPIEERQCKAKQLQLMTGTSPIIYWGASFVWDYLFMMILICAMTACFPIFEQYHAFTNYGGAGTAFLILFVYGFAAISFSYLMSLFTSSVPGGFAFVTIVHITTGMIINLVVYGLNTSDKKSLGNTIAWFGRLFPTFGAAMSTMIYTKTAAMNTRCNLISSDIKTSLCIPGIADSLNGSSWRRLFMCCDNCEELDIVCFKPQAYVTWYDPFDQEIGIGQELLYMFIMGLVYKTILIAIEYGIFRKILNMIFQADDLQFRCDSNDDDVLHENQRVQSLISTGRVTDDAFLVENLCKSFGSFSAVSKVSFGVRHGECFGLLGVNGAGKTTSFRMLTGDEIVSDGNAYAGLKTLKTNHKDFLSSIGYCPQFDGIIGVLTGREMLDLFARLRGISGASVRSETNKWLSRLGLMESADFHCENYSGGMKRRLSTAMAMMGDPPILMLDEPTTGVDPVARRELWKSIASSKNTGQAIILTSHSMEECEALCGRLGIMVNGEMQCMGGVQHLKTKFAQGFCLNLKLKYLVAADADRLNTLSDKIIKSFPSCILKDQHQNNLQYQIHDTSLGWDVLFQTMEDIKLEYINFLEEYSVCQTTLEEVFLSFAHRQYPERRANVSFVKKLMTCQLCGCSSR